MPVGWAEIVAPATQEQRPGGDGRTKTETAGLAGSVFRVGIYVEGIPSRLGGRREAAR